MVLTANANMDASSNNYLFWCHCFLIIWLFIYRHFLHKGTYRFLKLCCILIHNDIAKCIFRLSCIIYLDSVHFKVHISYFSSQFYAKPYRSQHRVFQRILHLLFLLKWFCYRTRFVYLRLVVLSFDFPLITFSIAQTEILHIFQWNSTAISASVCKYKVWTHGYSSVDWTESKSCYASLQAGLHGNVMNRSGCT